jgi:hypothetical protein
MNTVNSSMSPAELEKLDRFFQNAILFEAAKAYLSLQMRETHPPGSFDSAKRFFLDAEYPCCTGIRSPSRAYPYSQMVHGRSAAHVAFQYGLGQEESDIKGYARLMKKYPILKTSQNFSILFPTIEIPKQLKSN